MSSPPSRPAFFSRFDSCPKRSAGGACSPTRRSAPRAAPGGALVCCAGDEQPAEQAGFLQQVRQLPEALLGVLVLPEAVPGQRGRDDAAGEGQGGEAGGRAARGGGA